MTLREIRYPSATGLGNIYAEIYVPDKAWAVVQIVHGMAEHIARYADFARYLCERGVAVVLHDQAGHGKSLGNADDKGFFGLEKGKDAVLSDIKALRDLVAGEYPGVPYILMGHSMGSFFARAYAALYPMDISALIISGTSGKNSILGIADIIAKREIKKNGPRKPSELLKKLSFGSYNKAFEPARTANDWLSRDNLIVDAYCADELCGFAFTAEAMRDVFSVMRSVEGKTWGAKVPNVPILLFSGDKDPVGNSGKGVKQVYGWLKNTGHNAELKLYPDGRHEMLNEVNREEVYEYVYAFLKKCFP